VNLDFSKAEQRLWHIGTPDGKDREFRHAILGRLPHKFAEASADHYLKLERESGLQAANLFLLELKDKLPPCALSVMAHDEDLCNFAKLKAEKSTLIAAKHSLEDAYLILSQIANDNGLESPEVNDKKTVLGAVNRMKDELWWRTALRRTLGRTMEQVAIELGFVHKHAAIYVSDETLSRRREQKSRNKKVLQSTVATNEFGDEYTLDELAALSVSNPKLRRNELMTRIDGFEQVANKRGDVAVMYTLTCPSKMHARHSKSGDPVLKYDGTTPRQANKYMTNVWARMRSKLNRDGFKVYGMRVVEPMHDGTPHMHFLLFISPDEIEQVEEIFRHYALQEDGDEPGAQEYRFHVQRIDPEKGTATGYIAKYISKNIDGFGLDCDLYGREATSSAERVEAWASVWGIRQFQQVGGPPVTVWRVLRRMEEQSHEGLEKIRKEADVGNWAEYTELMGGPTAARKNHPLKLAHVYNDKPGRYGEPIGDQIFGLEIDGVTIVRPSYNWEISWKPLESGVGLVVKQEEGLERNCTQILERSSPGQGQGQEISNNLETVFRKTSKRAGTGFETSFEEGSSGFETGAGVNGLVSEPGPGGFETGAEVNGLISELGPGGAGPGADTGADTGAGKGPALPGVSKNLKISARSASDHLEFCQ